MVYARLHGVCEGGYAALESFVGGRGHAARLPVCSCIAGLALLG